MLSVAYFCIATEYKFISENSSKKYQILDNSELFHSKAVEISYCYLPYTSPIVKHYLTTYNKHFNTNLEPIVSLKSLL